MIETVKQNWFRLAGGYSDQRERIENLWLEIVGYYSGAGRYYHNLDHVAALLKWCDGFVQRMREPDVLRFSIFYHDIIYDVSRRDNESRSAALAGKRLTELGVEAGKIETCRTQIEATQNHSLDPDAEAGDIDYFLDFDLAVLGSAWETYLEYAGNIRREYQIYGDAQYREGRKKVLRGFLSAPAIFRTDYFRTHLETRARDNINRELSET